MFLNCFTSLFQLRVLHETIGNVVYFCLWLVNSVSGLSRKMCSLAYIEKLSIAYFCILHSQLGTPQFANCIARMGFHGHSS